MQPSFNRPDLAIRASSSPIHSLTSLRGIAAWWIVLYHFNTYLLPYVPIWAFRAIAKGHLAVDLFFCLSGFVIFLNYGRLNTASAPALYTFYLRRLAKIYPLHVFTIGLYVLLVGALLVTHRNVLGPRFSIESLLLNLFLVQNWSFLRELTWNVPSWSISAEFAAYLLFPVVIKVVRPTAGRLFPSLVIIALLLCALNFFYAPAGFSLGNRIETLGVVRCITQFTIGAILARVFLAGSLKRRFVLPCLFSLTAIFLFVGLTTWESVMVPLAWATLVLAVALGDKNLTWLNHPWLVFVGDISYATYMIHYFIRDIFKLAIVHVGEQTPIYYVLTALLAVAVVSVPLYLLIERPAQWRLTKTITARIPPKAAI